MKEIEVLCPEYRGAPQPEFDPMKINESRIPDNMRFKEYEYSQGCICGRPAGESIGLMWETQESYTVNDLAAFIAELRRAFEANCCTGTLAIALSDRDEQCKLLKFTLEFEEA